MASNAPNSEAASGPIPGGETSIGSIDAAQDVDDLLVLVDDQHTERAADDAVDRDPVLLHKANEL